MDNVQFDAGYGPDVTIEVPSPLPDEVGNPVPVGPTRDVAMGNYKQLQNWMKMGDFLLFDRTGYGAVEDGTGKTPVPVGPRCVVLLETGNGAEVVSPPLSEVVKLPVPIGADESVELHGVGYGTLPVPVGPT